MGRTTSAQRTNCWGWAFKHSSRRCVERGSPYPCNPATLQITLWVIPTARLDWITSIGFVQKMLILKSRHSPRLLFWRRAYWEREREKERCVPPEEHRSESPNSLLAKRCCHILCIQDNLSYLSQCFKDLTLHLGVSYLLPCNKLPPNTVA